MTAEAAQVHEDSFILDLRLVAECLKATTDEREEATRDLRMSDDAPPQSGHVGACKVLHQLRTDDKYSGSVLLRRGITDPKERILRRSLWSFADLFCEAL